MINQKASKVDRHYEIPLLLKDEDIQLPNNRAAAMTLLETLRRKFEKDDQFLKECKKFMEEMIDQVPKLGMFHIRLL